MIKFCLILCPPFRHSKLGYLFFHVTQNWTLSLLVELTCQRASRAKTRGGSIKDPCVTVYREEFIYNKILYILLPAKEAEKISSDPERCSKVTFNKSRRVEIVTSQPAWFFLDATAVNKVQKRRKESAIVGARRTSVVPMK